MKPLRGLDPNTYEAFVSQVQQEYPAFEILFGAANADDPAAAQVHRLQRQFPEKAIRLILGSEPAANGKVGVLIELAKHAQYPIWVVNDSDIRVGPFVPVRNRRAACGFFYRPCYLPLSREAAQSSGRMGSARHRHGFHAQHPGRAACRSSRVRPGLNACISRRGSGARRADFAAIADYLADDYQLAKRITALGKRALLSTYTVETALGDATWRGVWNHQLRWARTIRLTKGAAYLGLPITQAGIWCLIALVCGAWLPALDSCRASYLIGFGHRSSSFCAAG